MEVFYVPLECNSSSDPVVALQCSSDGSQASLTAPGYLWSLDVQLHSQTVASGVTLESIFRIAGGFTSYIFGSWD